jgi:cytoskeletal protein CcmA (bactofilin family)
LIISEDTVSNSKHEEDIEITESAHLTLYGMIIGNVRVDSNCSADIYGLINGDIHISAGAAVNVHGTVNGTIYNNDGTVRIWGTVERIVTTNGETFIKGDAVIRNNG